MLPNECNRGVGKGGGKQGEGKGGGASLPLNDDMKKILLQTASSSPEPVVVSTTGQILSLSSHISYTIRSFLSLSQSGSCGCAFRFMSPTSTPEHATQQPYIHTFISL